MDPKLEVGELLTHRLLNSSVDHECNMSIKMIRFMKGWRVAWIQNKVSFGLSYFRHGSISIYWSMFCVLWWSWPFIDTLKYFIHKVQYIVMPLRKILFAKKKKTLVSCCCPPSLIVCLYVISAKGFSDMGKRVRLQAWRKREVVWYQREEGSAFFEFQGFTGFVAAVGVLSLSWESFCHILSLLSVSHKDVCHQNSTKLET